MINKKNIEFLPNIINNFRFQMDSYFEKIIEDIYLNIFKCYQCADYTFVNS